MEASKTKLFSKDDLKKLIIPLLFEQALAITVGMADTVMISSAGEAAVSGVSLIDMFNNPVSYTHLCPGPDLFFHAG